MPYQLAREVVEVRLTSSVVEVFFKNKRVAAHLRRYDKGRHSTEAAHMPDSHRRYLEWTPGRIVHWAEKNGSRVREGARAALVLLFVGHLDLEARARPTTTRHGVHSGPPRAQ